MRYRVSETPVDKLTPDEVRAEAVKLRSELACIQRDIAAKKAWAQVDGKATDPTYQAWLARARTFESKVAKRYAVIRPVEKELNRQERGSSRRVSKEQFQNLEGRVSDLEGEKP